MNSPKKTNTLINFGNKFVNVETPWERWIKPNTMVLKLVNIIQMFTPYTNIKLALSTTEFLMGAN